MEIRNKKILITGGAGFIGTTLTSRLIENNQLVIFDNFHRDALTPSGLKGHPNLSIIEGSVLDTEKVSTAIDGCHMVVHMAAIAGVDTVMKMPVTTMKVSMIGTYNILEAALQQNRIERVIDFSTSEVFGSYAFKVNENDSTTLGAVGEARWTYAVSKLATEHLADCYYKQYKIPTVCIRPFNIYGPNQVGEGAIHHFILKALKSENLTIHNDGSQVRAWCYIDDIVDGIVLALTKSSAVGQSFNIGNPRSAITVYNLAREIVRLTGNRSSIEFVQWNHPDIELRVPCIDKARELLGYQPSIDLEEGLLRTIEWYKEHMNA
jgi:nucleoside-diphosphate-sugar epimerase